MDSTRNRARIDQTARMCVLLKGNIEIWLEKRRKRDEQKQYVTQLEALQSVLRDTLERLEGQLSGISAHESTGQVYHLCKVFDEYLLWVQRIWDYYRVRFDQRDEPATQEVLAAADEVVWSCFHQMFQHDPVKRPAPLPYIEASYSPEAKDRPPSELQAASISEDFLKKLNAYLRSLPIPMVRMPPNCATDPWWLVYLGHEIGHQVQSEAGLDQSFREQVSQAVLSSAKPGFEAETASRWGGWNNELFADIYSILMLGPAAMWSMKELEMTKPVSMLAERKPRYPAPVVRIRFMKELLSALGMNNLSLWDDPIIQQAVDGPPIDAAHLALQTTVKSDLLAAKEIVAALVQKPLSEPGGLVELTGWQANLFLPGGAADTWADLLLAPSAPLEEESLLAPRLILSGAVQAWVKIAALDDQVRSEQRDRLAKRLIPVLRKSREATPRAASPASMPPVDQLSQALTDLLLQTAPQELGVS